MTRRLEISQERISEFEPLTHEQRIKNKSNYARLVNITPMPSVLGRNMERLFTKPDDPKSLLVQNIRYRDFEGGRQSIESSHGSYDCHIATLSIMQEGSTTLAYYFFDTGQALKEVTNAERATSSPINKMDYDIIDNTLVSIEGKEFTSSSFNVF